MRIELTSIFVDDQDRAREFYTDVLGFHVRHDVPIGNGDSWLTVVSPERPDGPELLLEPSGHPAVGPYRQALVADGIPIAQLAVDDVHADIERLRGRGVTIVQEPMDIGMAIVAIFDDTCGNLIQLLEAKQSGPEAAEG